ncbi:MAG: AMP-binding protein, partial [Myxococcota bacterium]|nr:AMP-binding protein [Myxococcota bacterium]
MNLPVTTRFTAESVVLPSPVVLPGRDLALQRRSVWILELADAEGRRGRGIAAPLPGFSAEGADEVESCLRRLSEPGEPLAAGAPDSIQGLEALLDANPWPPSVAHAIEQAVLTLLAARAQCTATALVGGASSPPPWHALVHDGWSAQLAMAYGAAALKVKVGGGPDPLARVREVRAAVGDSMRLHVDVNGAWSEAEARRWLPALEALDVALVEEPMGDRDLATLAILRRATSMDLAADESCRTASDLDALLDLDAADAVVLKPMLVGGALRTAALARRAAAAGLEVVITHCFDGPMGQASVALAASLCPPEALRTVSGPPMSEDAVPHPLATAAAARPDHEAVAFEGQSLTYSALADRAAGFAAWLRRQGVSEGQVVALQAPTDIDWLVAFHGISWLGAIPAPLDPRLAPGEALNAQLTGLRPRLVLGPERLEGWPCAPLPKTLDGPRSRPATWRLSAPRVALFTSGTTTGPRAVTLTTSQLVCSAMGSRARLGHEPRDRWLCCLPLHHIGGLAIALRCAFHQTTMVLTAGFEARAVAERLRRGEASMISVVPVMLSRILDALGDHTTPSTLRVVLLGGAATPEPLWARCRALGVPLARTWGMTETGSQIATAAPDDHAPGLPPLPLIDVHAHHEALTVSGPLVGDIPLKTADRGRVDSEGRVHVEGRLDDVIISGGENLDGAAIEAALLGHPGVAAACVVAVDDRTWGQRPGACLVASHPERPTMTALRDALTTHLPPHAFPDHVCWVDALPRTSLGKVSRRGVAERLHRLAKAGGDVEGGEALHVDTGVDVTRRGADLAVDRAQHGEVEGDRGLADARDHHADGELLAHAHGPLEVGLGVDQRHAPTLLVEDVDQAVPDMDEELLVGLVTVKEDAPEERDASAIHLVEADG